MGALARAFVPGNPPGATGFWPCALEHSRSLPARKAREATQKVWEQHGWECTQRVGDVVAVPKGLMHGVVNIGEALAVAITQV